MEKARLVTEELETIVKADLYDGCVIDGLKFSNKIQKAVGQAMSSGYFDVKIKFDSDMEEYEGANQVYLLLIGTRSENEKEKNARITKKQKDKVRREKAKAIKEKEDKKLFEQMQKKYNW